MIGRKQKRVDLLSPKFRGTEALEKLDEELKKEKEPGKNTES
jgi:hypothetical protein